jgi:hypothetical protein
VPELIRLEPAADASEETMPEYANLNGRERKLYLALLAIVSVNVFVICGAASFLLLVFGR